MNDHRLRQYQRGVSVIIPVFNRWDLAERALNSALAQTYAKIEVIMVNDGSPLTPPAALNNIQDKRFNLVSLAENRGAAAARNIGVANAKYDLIAFLDSDDIWAPEKLTLQVAFMARFPQYSQVSCTNYYFGRKGGAKNRHIELRDNDNLATSQALLDGCYIGPGSTLMVRKEFFKKIGPMNESLNRLEDWEWMMRAARHTNIGILKESLCYVDQHNLPNLDVVCASTRVLLQSQREQVLKEFGAAGIKRFRSSLLIERAVSCVANRRLALAVAYILFASWTDPNRVYLFIKLNLCRKRKSPKNNRN